MNINIEYLNGNKTIGLFFLRSEAVIPDRFKNLILLIDGLSFGTFGFHPHEGFEDELILYIQKTNERVKTLFVKIDLNGIKFGFLRMNTGLKTKSGIHPSISYRKTEYLKVF